MRNELDVLKKLKQLLEEWQESHSTTLEDDEKMLMDLKRNDTEDGDDDSKWKKISAITYRLTRKRYISRLLKIVECIHLNISGKNDSNQENLLDSVKELCQSFQSAFTSPNARTEKYINNIVSKASDEDNE